MPEVAVLGRAPRYEGVFVLATYVGAAWAGSRLLGPDRTDSQTTTALRVLAGVALLVGLFAILEATGLRPLSTNVSRPGSLLGNASDEGTVGVLCFAPLFAAALRRRAAATGLGAAAAAVVTVLSASRGALLALAAEVVIIAVLLGGRKALAACIASVVLVAGLTFAVPATRHRVLGTSALAGHTVTGRGLLWRETLSLDAAHLALGVGPSNYKTAIIAEHSREWQQKVGPEEPPDSPHSIPLQALSVGGLPLLLAFVLLCGLVTLVGGREAWRSRRKSVPFEVGAFTALIGYGLSSMVGLTSPGPTLLASAFLGITLSTRPIAVRRDRGDAAIGTAFLALAAIFLLAAVAEIPLRHAVIQVGRGNPAGAARDFTAARVLRPWDVDLPDVAAHAFITYGITTNNSDAISQADSWFTRIPAELRRRDEQVELDHASIAEAHADYAAAAQLLTTLLARDRDNPAILLQRGVVEAEAGENTSAERDFKVAAAVAPTDPGPWQDLATLYRTEGNLRAAQRAQAQASLLAQ
ncbi:MAG TPA: O-antigen ligase family protein [Mycobacteriales bacterium]|nr:O-antigen ligase family protein [Mycobacteriales bacterium]